VSNIDIEKMQFKTKILQVLPETNEVKDAFQKAVNQ